VIANESEQENQMNEDLGKALDKTETAGRTFKAKATALVTDKFWVAIAVVAVIVLLAVWVF